MSDELDDNLVDLSHDEARGGGALKLIITNIVALSISNMTRVGKTTKIKNVMMRKSKKQQNISFIWISFFSFFFSCQILEVQMIRPFFLLHLPNQSSQRKKFCCHYYINFLYIGDPHLTGFR